MNTSFELAALMRRVIIGALAAASLLLPLAGCSALRLGYGQAPTLAYWWLDGYVDFTDAQSVRMREDIDKWFEWHRRTQLPEYLPLLARGRAEVMEPVTAAQVCRWNDEGMRLLDAALEQAVPAMAALAVSLSPAQLTHLERQFAKVNAEGEEKYLPPRPADRLKAAVKRADERAQMLLGKLNDAQLERLARGIAASPIDSATWIEERKARQQDILHALRRVQALASSKLPADRARAHDEAQAGMRALIANWHVSPREPYRALQARAVEYNCALGAEIHALGTPAQRKQAANRIKGWEEDARALIGQ